MNLFCQLSNLLGFFPVLYCLSYQLHLLAAVLALASVLSIIYHVNEDNRFALLADVIGCALILAMGIDVYRRSIVFFTWSNLITIALASAALTCYICAGEDTCSEQYAVLHSAWHVLSWYAVAMFLYSYVNTSVAGGSRVLCRPLRPIFIRVLTRWRKPPQDERAPVGAEGLQQPLPDALEGQLAVVRA